MRLRSDSDIAAFDSEPMSGCFTRLASADVPLKSSTYGGNNLKPMNRKNPSTPSMNSRLQNVMPFWVSRICMVSSSWLNLVNGDADAVPDDTLPEPAFRRHRIPAEPDQECPADQVFVRHETPVTAVVALVAVIAHDEILPRRHRERIGTVIRPVAQEKVVTRTVEVLDPAHEHAGAGFRVEQRVGTRIFLFHRHAVDGELLILIYNMISGNANHALDVVDRRVAGEAKNRHLAASRRAQVHQLRVRHRQTDAVGKF